MHVARTNLFRFDLDGFSAVVSRDKGVTVIEFKQMKSTQLFQAEMVFIRNVQTPVYLGSSFATASSCRTLICESRACSRFLWNVMNSMNCLLCRGDELLRG